MFSDKTVALFLLVATVILYCTVATLVQPAGQRIEKQYGVSVARFR